MEIRQLEYFVTVAEQLNFSRAAELLYVTQPLLSKQIAELEKQLGVKLFLRNRRSVRLTPAGAALLHEAKIILLRFGNIPKIVMDADAGIGLGGSLRVGYEQVFERTVITEALYRFHARYPDVSCAAECYDLSRIMHALNGEGIDLAFTLLPNDRLGKDYEVMKVGHDVLSLVAAAPLLEGKDLETALKLVETMPLYLLSHDMRGLNSSLKVLIQAGISPQSFFMDSVSTILMNVEAGAGVSMLPTKVIETYSSRNLAHIPIENSEFAKLDMAACWRKDCVNPLIQLFIGELNYGAEKPARFSSL